MSYDNLTRSGVRDECGVFGIYGPGLDVARLTFYGLYALQHRGQESAGIAVASGGGIELYKNMGLVTEVFNEERLRNLNGDLAVGHVRYSTTGSSSLTNAQPLVFNYLQGPMSLAHNGNLTNATALRHSQAAGGSIFQTTTDSEIIANQLALHADVPLEKALEMCMDELQGAYSLLIMTPDRLIGVRDPYGVRPLCLGQMGEAYVLASESCALDTVGATFIRDLNPGEVVVIDENGPRSVYQASVSRAAHCVFEFVYLARPDSAIDGRTVTLARREMGHQLAREYHVEADMVISVPDSGTAAAMGYSEESGLPYREGMLKNRYSGRTFIQPTQAVRDLGVRLKLNPIREVLAGKRIVMVDDSIVRGTTSRKIIQMLRSAGVREIHVAVASPPILFPCYYGIDTSERSQLIAARLGVKETCDYIGADSLHYLSMEGLLRAVRGTERQFCVACFNGEYPIAITPEGGKFSLGVAVH